MRDQVERAGFSAKGDLYQLARLALLERSDDFFALLPRALQSAAVSESELREWPIFQDIRGDSRYAQYALPAPKRKRGITKKSTKKTDPGAA